MRHHIVGTTLFDGDQAQKGYALNRMCFSFNSAENRAAFLANEDAYCAKYGLTKEQRAAVKSRNVLKLIEAGGNVYYLAKLAGIFGLNVQDIGAQQTGMSVAAFKQKLAAAGRWTCASSVASGRRMFPRLARRLPTASRTIRIGGHSSRA